MLGTAKRYVTGENAEGRSTLVECGLSPAILADEATGEGAAEIWVARAVPESIGNIADHAAGGIKLTPPPGGLSARLFAVAPGEGPPADFGAAREAARAAYAAIEGEGALIDSPRHPAMHRTETLDLVVVVQGELTLILDDGEAVLRPGDTVIQCGTAHAWENRGEDLAVGFVVLIDAAEAEAHIR